MEHVDSVSELKTCLDGNIVDFKHIDLLNSEFLLHPRRMRRASGYSRSI